VSSSPRDYSRTSVHLSALQKLCNASAMNQGRLTKGEMNSEEEV